MIFVEKQSKSAIFDRGNPMIFVEKQSKSAIFHRGNPMIFVANNDVKFYHGCRIPRNAPTTL